jgi:hypothetical protein
LDRARSSLLADTVEKLDFLPRSQFLKQQASFKKKVLRGSASPAAAPALFRGSAPPLKRRQKLFRVDRRKK